MGGMLTPWVQRLLIANVVLYFLVPRGSDLYTLLWYYPPQAVIHPWSIVTYMFLHGGFGHLFGNMIGIFFFGPRLEQRLGSTTFIWMYLVAGALGAVFQTIFSPAAPMIGASGGVYGVLLGFALYWPREKVLIIPIPFPIEARILVGGYIILSIWQGVASVGAGVAHFAHLGGAAGAFAFLKWVDWKRGSAQRDFKRKMAPGASRSGPVGDRVAVARWKGISVEALHELNRDEVVRLLKKVDEQGPESLTDSERAFLDRMSQS